MLNDIDLAEVDEEVPRSGSTSGGVARPESSTPMTPRVRRPGPTVYLVWIVTGLAICSGIAMRAWNLFHRPVNADEAIVGLMADQIAHGHMSAFYWGQAYGGGEPYLVALLFRIFGSSVWAMELVPVLLAAVTAVLTWRVARRLVPDPALALLAGALVWASPKSALSNSTLELGFRGLTMACSLGLVLVALRILDGRRRTLEFVGLGLVAGVGWWSSPEIIYFALPAVLLLGLAFVGDRGDGRGRRWASRMAVVVVSGIVGSLPWLWANVHSRFQSLRPSAFALPPGSPGYVGRLHIFFQYSLPMLLNLRSEGSGAWLWSRSVSLALLAVGVAVFAVALCLCLLRDGRSRIFAIAVMAFPFLVALSPATWYWGDGRYVDFVGPLLAIVVTIGCADAAERLVQWRRRARALRRRHVREGRAPERALGRCMLAFLVTVMVVVCIVDFGRFVNPLSSFAAGWGDPNGPVNQSVAILEANGVRAGYADYWVAYPLDLVGDGRLEITTAGGDPDRWASLDRQVHESSSQAWLFVAPDAAGINQFASTLAIQGPDGISQAAFVADLDRLRIPYKVIDAGLVQAVVPSRPVPLSSVGLQRPT
jgi:hypothetical protein